MNETLLKIKEATKKIKEYHGTLKEMKEKDIYICKTYDEDIEYFHSEIIVSLSQENTIDIVNDEGSDAYEILDLEKTDKIDNDFLKNAIIKKCRFLLKNQENGIDFELIALAQELENEELSKIIDEQVDNIENEIKNKQEELKELKEMLDFLKNK